MPRRAEALLPALFSLTAMLMYVAYSGQVYDDDRYRMHHETAAVTFIAPLVFAAFLLLRRWRTRGHL